MVEQPLCFFSVVRYVADPIRDEAKNIGIVLLCPEKNYGKSRFLMSRLYLKRDSRRYAVLQSLIRGYQIELPGEYEENLYERTLFAPLPQQWTKATLDQFHGECTNLLQFSRPAAILGNPELVLNELFEERVQAKGGGKKTSQTGKVAARIFKRTFHLYGLDDWIEEDAEIPVQHHNYRFDIGIRNGSLRYAIKTLSFQKADLQRVEEAGGYYAHIWQTVSRETGAKGLWLVEPPPQFDAMLERFNLVTSWANEAGIAVRDFNETKQVAQEIADEMQSLSPTHV
jgi:Protein of unknown function (DUF3037)